MQLYFGWERWPSQRVQKCFLPQLGCFQARAGPSILHCMCWVVRAFSWQSSEGRGLRVMAGARFSWRVGGRWGGCDQGPGKMCERHEEQTKWTHVHPGTYPALVCSSHRLCMMEFVRLPCRLRMSLFLFLFLFTLTLVQTSRNGFSAGTYHGMWRWGAAQVPPTPRCAVPVRAQGSFPGQTSQAEEFILP